ncbi:hypothetical protein G6F52_014047 [Rhizopus delemar]|nr:hypothetical protein G6F52_014047 [Rhizopus delemar]
MPSSCATTRVTRLAASAPSPVGGRGPSARRIQPDAPAIGGHDRRAGRGRRPARLNPLARTTRIRRIGGVSAGVRPTRRSVPAASRASRLPPGPARRTRRPTTPA